MKQYLIKKDGNMYNIIEKSTNYCIGSYKTYLEASFKSLDLEKGNGFAGHTPQFFLIPGLKTAA